MNFEFWKNITYISNLIAIYSKGFFWIFLLILPLCSIYRHGGHDGWSAGSLDITFKGNPLRMIQAKFGLNWLSGFRGEDFWKIFTDGRQTPSDGNSSYRWAKNCSVGRSWQAEHVCSLRFFEIDQLETKLPVAAIFVNASGLNEHFL